MFRFVSQKILNKKWLISCLLVGVILFIAIACCNPMYTRAALQKTLTDELENQMIETNQYPAVTEVTGTLSENRLNRYSSELFPDYHTAADDLAALYEIQPESKVTLLESEKFDLTPNVSRDGLKGISARINTLFGLNDHINIIYGELYSDSESDNVYECIISEKMLVSEGLLIGDTFTSSISSSNDKNIEFKITGVFQAKEQNDSFWVKDPLDYDANFFISEKDFDEIFMTDKMTTSVTAYYYAVFDYQSIDIEDINSFFETNNRIRQDSVDNGLYSGEFNFEESFLTYREGSNKVTVTMWVFQIPVLILLSVFIFMVSNQIISIEQGEIAMLKSRGVSKKQLILSYLLQGTIISFVALLIGIPLGYLFCQFFGATKSFLEFSTQTSIDVRITWLSIVYALVAMLVSIAFMTLPVLKYANFSIVEQKANKKKSTKPLWQKVYLDFILLAASLYGFYSFNKQKDTIIKNITEGDSIDPLLYFSSTIFILAVALIFLRIIPLISKLVYAIGIKKWKPDTFAAFMQVNHNIRKQSFIIVFLSLTLALGIFNATTARSINDNEEMRIKYENGAELVLQEKWSSNAPAVKLGYADELEYTEPDFTVYNELDSEINSITKVLVDEHASVLINGVLNNDSTYFQAIYTDEFAHTAYLPEGATRFHWYYYLNALAREPYGAIISRNFAETAGLKIGSSVSVYRTDELVQSMELLTLKVVSIVDAWPGYENKIQTIGDDGKTTYKDQYLVVTNFDTALRTYDVEPYQIWINSDNNDFIYDFANEKNLTYELFIDSQQQSDDVKEQPFFQVTSGMLTITFFVVLILSMIGFLIYWITSIKSRELIFGIYRAMGMSMKEIIRMLVVEHIFGSLLPIVAGIMVGILSARMFVPLIQLAYSPTYSTLETLIITSASDMINLGLCVLIMLVICFTIIGRLLSHMKITQALKLGED